MSSGKKYVDCVWCKAANNSLNQHCWRCGGELPYFVDCHGQTHVQIAPQAQINRPAPAEIEALLDQATLIDLEPPAPPQSSGIRQVFANVVRHIHLPRLLRSRHNT
jgi:hypothetical protein